MELNDIKTSTKGQVKNFITNETFYSNSNMTSEEIVRIAIAAKLANYFDGHVNWCKTALKTAKVKRTFLIISPLKFLALLRYLHSLSQLWKLKLVSFVIISSDQFKIRKG